LAGWISGNLCDLQIQLAIKKAAIEVFCGALAKPARSTKPTTTRRLNLDIAMRWIFFSCMALLILIGGTTSLSIWYLTQPKTLAELRRNAEQNLRRSFEEEGFAVSLAGTNVQDDPFQIVWDELRLAKPATGSALRDLIEEVVFSDCYLRPGLSGLRVKLTLRCALIQLKHPALDWRRPPNAAYETIRNTYFVASDWNTFHRKQGWLHVFVKAQQLRVNGTVSADLEMDYRFVEDLALQLRFPRLDKEYRIEPQPEGLLLQSGEEEILILNPSRRQAIFSSPDLPE
jgi:hypothetical protein